MKQNQLGVRLRWLSTACYEIDCGGTHVVIDPHITLCSGNNLTAEVIERCDMIALTHLHWDHSTDVPWLMEKFNPLLLCPVGSMQAVAQWLDCCPSRIYPMYPDVELDFGPVKVKPLFGRHIKLTSTFRTLQKPTHFNRVSSEVPGLRALQPKATLNYNAYLFTLKNGVKILYWGGNLAKEQIPLCTALKPDIAILQMSPTEWGISRRVDFAKTLGAKVVMLQHQGLRENYHPGAVERFGEVFLERVPDRTYINPKNGEWIEL